MGNLRKFALPAGITVAVAAIVTVLIVFLAGDDEVYRLIKINRFEGAVTVERGEVMDAFEGLQLVSEDIVKTGTESTAELLADTDKHILAEENTTFIIEATGTEKSGKIKINLLYGRSLFTIDNKLNEDSYFEVTTPNASMSVRGTSFWVEYIPEENTTIVEVIEGVVETNYYGVSELLKVGDERVITPEFSESDNQIDSSVTDTTLSEETTTPETAETTVPAVTTAPMVTTVPEGTTASTVLPEETTVPETTTAPETTTVPVETTEITTVPTETTVPETTTRRPTTRPSTTTRRTTTPETVAPPETTTTAETTMPANGYPTYIIGNYDIDRSATQYDLDENGRPEIARLYDTDGNLAYYNMYEYNDDGTVTVELLQADLTLDAVYLLDEDGNVIKQTSYNAYGKIKDCSEFVYDDGSSNPRRTKYTTYTYDGNVLKSYYEMYYSDDGKLAREISYDADGNPTTFSYYDYYDDGSLKSDSRHNADNELYEYVEYYEGGELGKEIIKEKITNYSEGTSSKLEYNSAGQMIKSSSYTGLNAGGDLKYYTIYEYYGNGSRKQQTSYDSSDRVTSVSYFNENDEYTGHIDYSYVGENLVKISEHYANGNEKEVRINYYNGDVLDYYSITKYNENGVLESTTTYNADGTVRE